ncbi:MAG: efflux RND transporter periplasmic adaptor subunit [Planctomycetales bacterium]|nr:efflux RND transporter periplasmic adaptor subunit [Planctomycetales bacterium]
MSRLSNRRIAACCLLVAIVCSKSSVTTSAQEAKPVVVARVTESEVRAGQRFVGTVNPRRTSTVGSAVDGRVQSFLVNQGDAVSEGQVLAQLRTETLEIEKAAAAAELQLAQQRLAELENGSRPEDIAEAEANVRSAEARLTNAESKLHRMETLATRGASSTTDLQDAQEQAKAAKFTLQATEALYKRIKDGPRVEAIAQARAEVELQTQRLNLINDRIEKFTIISPFDGYVSAEFTEIGAWISRGDAIAEVIQMDEVEVQAPVPAEAVVNLRKGDVLRVEFPDLPNELFTGTIDRIVPIATSRARTFPVIIHLQNKIIDGAPMLLAGMMARVDFPAGERQRLPLIPKDALVLNGTDRAVFVVDSGVARKVAVDLGVAVEDRIQVRGAIKIDDVVVVVGNERLVPNSSVKVIDEIE